MSATIQAVQIEPEASKVAQNPAQQTDESGGKAKQDCEEKRAKPREVSVLPYVLQALKVGDIGLEHQPFSTGKIDMSTLVALLVALLRPKPM